jgi:hypothetical protein
MTVAAEQLTRLSETASEQIARISELEAEAERLKYKLNAAEQEGKRLRCKLRASRQRNVNLAARAGVLEERLNTIFQLVKGLRQMTGADSTWTHARRNRYLENVSDLMTLWRESDAILKSEAEGDSELRPDEIPF